MGFGDGFVPLENPLVQYSFCIAGKPVIQQRARTVTKGGRTWTYDKSAKERKTLSLALFYARQIAKASILGGDLSVDMVFYGGGNRSDLSNMVKAVEDSGNQILWKDDKQIVEEHTRMVREDANPRTEVTIHYEEQPAAEHPQSSQ